MKWISTILGYLFGNNTYNNYYYIPQMIITLFGKMEYHMHYHNPIIVTDEETASRLAAARNADAPSESPVSSEPELLDVDTKNE